MNILEKLEQYFSSGTPEKQNKKRVGGLLIGITAVILALCIALLAVASVIGLVQGIVGAFDKPQDDNDDAPVARTALATLGDFETARMDGTSPAFTLDNNDVLPTSSQLTVLKDNAEAYTRGSSKHALQKEAYVAFEAMVTEFYAKHKKVVHVVSAYETYGQGEENPNSEQFKNALAVKLTYKVDGKATSIMGVEDYEWIFENAHDYGFVRVSAAEDSANILRYVGLVSADYIYKKQAKCDEEKGEFYTVSDYIEDVKQGELTVRSIPTSLEEDAKKATHWVYFVSNAPEKQGEMMLPIAEKHAFTVSRVSDGYIVVYCKD